MLHELVVLQDVVLEIELGPGLRYRLRYGELVEYENGRRKLRGRSSRYDFERDVAAAGGRLGENA